MISFNPSVKLILSDVDETIADVYTDAEAEMIERLEDLLKENRHLFLISGGGLESILNRVALKIAPQLRHLILIGHCSGAEVWGFTKEGDLRDRPFYSIYEDKFTDKQKSLFRKLTEQVITEFKLETFPTMPVSEFIKITKKDPSSIMYVDRGPQITLELVNSYNMKAADGTFTDLRVALAHRFDQLFKENDLPIESSLGGVFALDLKIKGVSKITAIRYILDNDMAIHGYDLALNKGKESKEIEIWGDKFSTISGSDRYMCLAMPKNVRAIDFRQEPLEELPQGYNIVIWDGEKRLQQGCLEYLNSYFNNHGSRS
jgi:hydroxymethylpyrimidine pyrophosphatase-like HAD family hydrolase